MENTSVTHLRTLAESLAAISLSHLSSNTRLKLANDDLSVNAYPTDCGGDFRDRRVGRHCLAEIRQRSGRNRRTADFRNAGTGILSRHNIRLMYAGRPVLVVAGYDRPLRELFLQVFRCQESVLAGEDEIVYDSLHEPAPDWTIIGTLTGKLDALGIKVPATMIEAVYLDQRFTADNIVVWHHANHSPAEV